MDLKTLGSSINQIALEKGISPEKVIEAIEIALAAAYKKQYLKKTEMVKADFDPKTGLLKFWKKRLVIDEKMIASDKTKKAEEEKIRHIPEYHIFLEEAKKKKPKIKVGEEILEPLEEHEEFSRIAAQTAKQVIIQKIREFEKKSILEEFQDKEGEIISGVIQKFDRGNIYVDLGRSIGVMFANESIPGEHYRIGERARFYVLAVQEEGRLPGIILSRANPEFIKKLFELEVPEIAEKIVEIKSIAREPGYRTKIAVFSNQEGLDPVGSCIGQRGMRVIAITNELGNEKIDIIEWAKEPEKFIANSLSPAKVKSVEILPRREAKVLADEDQLSLALGKGGQNVRLAAKLTGWKIEISSNK